MRRLLLSVILLTGFATAAAAAEDADLYRKSEMAFRAKDYVAAVAGYSEIIDKFPSSRYYPYARYSLGWAQFETGRFEDAEKTFDGFLTEFHEHPLAAESLFKLGQSLYEQKKYAAAVEKLTLFIREYSLNAKIPNAAYLIGQSLAKSGDPEKAAEAFRKCLTLAPAAAFADHARLGLALSLFETGRYDESMKAFEAAPKDAALAAEFAFGRARALAALGRHAEAEAAFVRVGQDFAGSPIEPDSLFWRGESVYHQARYPEAAAVFTDYLSRYPSGELADDARYDLGRTRLAMKDPEAAFGEFEIVAEAGRNDALRAASWCELGDLYLDRGDPEKALETYDRVLKEFPSSGFADDAQYRMATALGKLGRADASNLAFKTLLLNFPDSRFAPAARAALDAASQAPDNAVKSVKTVKP